MSSAPALLIKSIMTACKGSVISTHTLSSVSSQVKTKRRMWAACSEWIDYKSLSDYVILEANAVANRCGQMFDPLYCIAELRNKVSLTSMESGNIQKTDCSQCSSGYIFLHDTNFSPHPRHSATSVNRTSNGNVTKWTYKPSWFDLRASGENSQQIIGSSLTLSSEYKQTIYWNDTWITPWNRSCNT